MRQRVIFEFLGGCMDGKTVCTYSQNREEVEEAEGYLWVSNNGTKGARFMATPPAAMQLLKEGRAEEAKGFGLGFRKYEVVERIENGDEVLVRAKNMPS